MDYNQKLKSSAWQKKRLEILLRDNFTCILCGSTEKELHVHHLKYAKTGLPQDASNNDLITYCFLCHQVAEDLKNISGKIHRIKSKTGGFLRVFFTDNKTGRLNLALYQVLKNGKINFLYLTFESQLEDFLNDLKEIKSSIVTNG